MATTPGDAEHGFADPDCWNLRWLQELIFDSVDKLVIKVPEASPYIAASVLNRFWDMDLAGAKFYLGDEDLLLVMYLRADTIVDVSTVLRYAEDIGAQPVILHNATVAHPYRVWLGASTDSNSLCASLV